jgi:Proteasome non-ATPase 26S subunit
MPGGAEAASSFWADVNVYLRGAIHREAATSAEAVLLLPSPAAFLAKYSLATVLAELDHILEMVSHPRSGGNEAEEQEDGDDFLLFPSGLEHDAKKKLGVGCELLEKLIGSAAVFADATSPVESLLSIVVAAARSSAGCLRRIAAAFFQRLAEGSFSLEGTTEAVTGDIATARALLWERDNLQALIELFGDRDTVTGERASDAIIALLAGTSNGIAGGSSASNRLSLSSEPASSSQIALLTEELDSTLIGGPAGGEGTEAVSAISPFLADLSIRIVRLAALLASLSKKDKAVADRAVGAFVTTGLMEVVMDAATLDEDDGDNDVLTLLSVLEYLPAIAGVPAGAKAILDAELVSQKHLLGWSGVSSDDGEGDSFLGPSALATLAELYSELKRGPSSALSPSSIDAINIIFTQCVPGIFRATARACASGQPADTSARAINACSTFVASDSEALRAFLAPENSLYAREWLESGVSSTAELRVAALSGVGLIFERAASAAASSGEVAAASAGSGSASSASASPSAFPLHLELFNRFGTCCGRDAGEVALLALKKPDLESRLAAYQFLTSVCSLPATDAWNLRRVWGAAGLATHLLDRTTEHEKLGKEGKFAVVEATMRNPNKNSLGDFFLTQLRTFYSQGPYYKPVGAARVELAT